jgi:hypothetical protein
MSGAPKLTADNQAGRIDFAIVAPGCNSLIGK